METVLQFRRSLSFIRSDSAFSNDFGNSRTREECIENAQKLFERLVQKPGNDVLDFEVLCLIARTKDKSVSRAKVKELIRLFRPSRSGKLTKLDFAKSIDR
jgi:Ca2+-binding EF-hand superfamily protein